METTVVNRRRSEFDVYIGRGSKWGNDFSHRPGTKALVVVASVEEAIERFRQQLWERIQVGAVTLEELSELRGKRLGCYCKPGPCHGDVLAAAAEWAHGQLGRE